MLSFKIKGPLRGPSGEPKARDRLKDRSLCDSPVCGYFPANVCCPDCQDFEQTLSCRLAFSVVVGFGYAFLSVEVLVLTNRIIIMAAMEQAGISVLHESPSQTTRLFQLGSNANCNPTSQQVQVA